MCRGSWDLTSYGSELLILKSHAITDHSNLLYYVHELEWPYLPHYDDPRILFQNFLQNEVFWDLDFLLRNSLKNHRQHSLVIVIFYDYSHLKDLNFLIYFFPREKVSNYMILKIKKSCE